MQFFTAIRGKSTLPPDIMELAMCRVGALNGAAYEWMHHAPLLIKAQVGADGVETVRTAPVHARLSGKKESDGTVQGLSEDHWAVLRYVDAMTKDVKVPEEVFEGVRRILNERQVVELSK
jgi:alkylhydroperoxidase family enzyme